VCKTKKLTLWHKLSIHPLDTSLLIKYRECCSLWNRLVQNHEAETEKHITEARNLGAFYRYINNRFTHKDSIRAIVTSDNTVLTDDMEKGSQMIEICPIALILSTIINVQHLLLLHTETC